MDFSYQVPIESIYAVFRSHSTSCSVVKLNLHMLQLKYKKMSRCRDSSCNLLFLSLGSELKKEEKGSEPPSFLGASKEIISIAVPTSARGEKRKYIRNWYRMHYCCVKCFSKSNDVINILVII